jgi:hypothetical protein
VEIIYRKRIAYPIDRVLAQYFDLEHIAHVHPRTFGEARLVSSHYNCVVWDLISPRFLGFRARSRIVQSYEAPYSIRACVTQGAFRGATIHTTLESDGGGTLIEETYRIPLPGWRWLQGLMRQRLCRRLDRIWEEDLKVGVCHGGWPGVPQSG